MEETDRDTIRVIALDEVQKCRQEEREELKEMRDDVKKILAFSVAQVVIVLVGLVGFLGAKVIHLPDAAAASLITYIPILGLLLK